MAALVVSTSGEPLVYLGIESRWNPASGMDWRTSPGGSRDRRIERRGADLLRPFIVSGTGHRARTASTAAAAGTTMLATAVPPTATGTTRATAGTTWASASPSAHASRSGGTAGLNRPASGSRGTGYHGTNPTVAPPGAVALSSRRGGQGGRGAAIIFLILRDLDHPGDGEQLVAFV